MALSAHLDALLRYPDCHSEALLTADARLQCFWRARPQVWAVDAAHNHWKVVDAVTRKTYLNWRCRVQSNEAERADQK